MIRFLNAVAYIATCGALGLVILATLAMTPTLALADDGNGSFNALHCACSHCDTNCVGTTTPCTGSCNTRDQTCINQGGECDNCGCANGDKTNNCSCF